MRPPVVFCDFDGTITEQDVIDLLLQELADKEWQNVEREWVDGRIGSRECLARQIPLIRGGWKAVEKVLQSVQIKPTFPPFVQWCRASNIPVIIVSDCVDRVIVSLLNRHDVEVDAIASNQMILDGERCSITFPSSKPACNCGVCKCATFERFPGCTSVVVGDGGSDFCWSKKGDVIFAKKALEQYCLREGIAYHCFANFEEIQAKLAKDFKLSLLRRVA